MNQIKTSFYWGNTYFVISSWWQFQNQSVRTIKQISINTQFMVVYDKLNLSLLSLYTFLISDIENSLIRSELTNVVF